MPKSKLAYNYISAVLKWGSYLSLFILLLGLILLFFVSTPIPITFQVKALSLSQLTNELFKLNIVAFINLGLLVLMITPILRVTVAIFSFILEKDSKYTIIASGVLLVLMFSLLLAA